MAVSRATDAKDQDDEGSWRAAAGGQGQLSCTDAIICGQLLLEHSKMIWIKKEAITG
jgi:hypothetical protein